MDYPDIIKSATHGIQEKLGNVQPASVGLILGTGLDRTSQSLSIEKSISYRDIPGFPVSTVQSHEGSLAYGNASGRPILALRGRFHLYEGFTASEACTGVRVLGELGVKTLIVTNAAGALNPSFDAGTPMLIDDHINFTGHNPLRGPNNDAWGPRFPDMSSPYSEKLRDLAMQKALELGLRLERGVYVQVMGPSLETPAETRAYRLLGADAVGMSTAIETIAARHMGMEVMGLTCLTNKNLPDCMAETSLEQVIAQAEKSAGSLGKIIEAVIGSLG